MTTSSPIMTDRAPIDRQPDRQPDPPLDPPLERFLAALNDTRVGYPEDRTIAQLFSEQAARSPAAVALTYKDAQITYGELNTRANRLAHHLIARGVTEDTIVGVWLDRSPDMVAALLAILKAGGAYLPLDLAYPADRLAHMLGDTRAPIVITRPEFVATLPPGGAEVVVLDPAGAALAHQPTTDPAPRGSADSLAYVNYTSGSTGRPKGVPIPQRGVLRLVFGASYARLDASRVFLQLAPACFDAATFELWGPLLHGGRCVLFDDKLPTLQKLRQVIERNRVTTLFITTALFNTIIDEDPQLLAPIEQLLTGGEAHSVPHMRKALRELPGTQISSVYGPTETTTFATFHPVPSLPPEATSIPIGRPIGNTTTYILDDQLRRVGVGVVGELYIGGDGLARGYLHQPELTREKFVSNLGFLPPHERLYRTGDLAKYLPDGSIDFIGRADNQVKIHGFRIELGEIESQLITHSGVRQAAVVVHDRSYADRRLIAYLIPDTRPDTRPDTQRSRVTEARELRAHLQQRLPAYMIPAQFEWLEAFPLTPNGKVDRKELARLATTAHRATERADSHD
jgi:amino acid adenylation domain-containing protein